MVGRISILMLGLCLAFPARAEPDIGEAGVLQGMRRAWFSIQSVVFKSNLGGTHLSKLVESDRDDLKAKLQALKNDRFLPRLVAAGLDVESASPLVESALDILHELQDEDSSQKITREKIVHRAQRANRKARDDRDPHLRLFIEIQQDGLKHIGRFELSLIEPVSPERNPAGRFHTVTWLKSEEAVDLGLRIDRDLLEACALRLLDQFEADLKNTP